MDKPMWMWASFAGVVLVLLVLDLGVLHRKQREIGVKESLWLSLFYITIALLYGGWIWTSLGEQSGKEYLTGYFVEKSLSLDNVFVMSLVFQTFAIPRIYQHRVLFWGILGVIILRGMMIGLGAALVAEFHWVLYIFALFLMYTGFRMLFAADEDHDIEKNKLLGFLRKHIRVTPELHGHHFFIRAPHPSGSPKRVLWATPLLVALVCVETVDLVFAVDSIPAIFAITTDPYIVFTSNIFAILGLRALFFALSAIIHRFSYLKYALALVLMFIGSKIFIADFMLSEGEKFPASVSLGITFALLAGGILVSLMKTRAAETKAE